MMHSMHGKKACAPRAGHGPAQVITAGTILLASSLGGISAACAQPAKSPYPSMAPIEQYLSKAPADEIALARSAAPPAISADADVLVLGSHGYEAAVKGKNGFVCFVERSWANHIDNDEFWNPKMRAPNCYNAAAVRSVLPPYLKRTEWVLAGVPKQELVERTKAALASKAFANPEPGSLSYMMSAQGHLNDAAGHWHPHVMLFVPGSAAASWGANLPGSPILAQEGDDTDPMTVFFIPVRAWSDGTPGPELK
jgi:hypothetical protein